MRICVVRASLAMLGVIRAGRIAKIHWRYEASGRGRVSIQ